MGSHQLKRGQVRHGTIGRVQAVRVPRRRLSVERKFQYDMETRALKFKAPPKRPAKSRNPPAKILPYHLRRTVQEHGPQPSAPSSAARNPLLEQILTPRLKETSVKAVLVQAPGKRVVILVKDRVWKCIPSVCRSQRE